MALTARLWLLRVGALAAALLLAAALTAWRQAEVAAIDARLFDQAWRLAVRLAPPPEERLLLVDIDEASLAALGPWPWPRARLAELAERLAAHGAAMQLWDLVLDAARDDDARLARALRAARGMLAVAFALPGQGEPVASGTLDATTPWAKRLALPCRPPWPQAHGQRAPAAAYADVPAGHITPRVDADGIVRALPAYVCRDGRAWPALPLAAWLELTGAADVRLLPESHPLAPAWKLKSQGLTADIPLGPAGELVVPYWRGASAYRAVSAADVLAGRIPPELIRGRIVLVGATALGLADAVATPLAGVSAGLLVHAELLSGLLDDRLPHAPKHATWLQGGAAVAAALLLLLLAARRPAAWALPLAGLALGLMLLALQAALLLRTGLMLGLAWPALAALLSGLTLGAVEHLQSEGERGRLFAHLASFLPAPMAERLRREPPRAGVHAELAQVSVMVADLRNFSRFSELKPAAEVADLLHDFFNEAVACVEATGGVVEALEGDAVLAVWNGRLPCPQPEAQALAAARCLLARMAARLPQGDPEALPPPLGLGIGLDAGAVLVGAIGPRKRRQHLALGLPVTRAARLAQLTHELGHPILVADAFYARLPSAERTAFTPQGEFLLEGLSTPCGLYAAS